jgi:NAD(P)-dependent dehydrogenase (short-subunit alcohol dehydrogenase family)
MTAGPLHGKKVVVIGGTSGIGFAVARGALIEGAAVIVASSGAANVEAAMKKLGDGAAGSAVNVRDEADVAAFFDRTGAFDHLVFTAGDWGFVRGGPLRDLDLGGAGAGFEVRFWGALRAIKHASEHIAPGGSITLTDGVVAHRPPKGAALASAMAGAIEHLVRALAIDLAPVRVNAVCPGLVLTEVWNSIPADQRDERIRQMTARQPLPRGGDPAELAEAYLYLMRGSFTTGQVLIVDGGMSLV